MTAFCNHPGTFKMSCSPGATSSGSDLIGLMYGGLSVSFKSVPSYSNEQLQQMTTALSTISPAVKCAGLRRIMRYRREVTGKGKGSVSTMLGIIHGMIKFSWFSSMGPHNFTVA